MIVRRYIATASVVCSLTFGFAGSAFAADVNVHTTGANSNQNVTISNTSDVVVTNTNSVQAVNVNAQNANSGNVVADKNTSVHGSVGTGSAMNNATAVTSVGVTNAPANVLPIGGSGSQAGTGQVAGSTTAGTPSVLGAATVGGRGGAGSIATLPSVGASVPMDVSALRAAWHPATEAPTATLAKSSQMFSNAMLLTATLLSLIGALGSAWYAKRREERV